MSGPTWTWYESKKTIGVINGNWYHDNSDAGAHVEHITSAEYNVKVTQSKVLCYLLLYTPRLIL